jgi:hypothetical protein
MTVTEGEKGPPRGVKVAPTNRAAVRKLTSALREHLGEHGAVIDVARFIEHKLAVEFDLVFVSRSRAVMGEDEGRTFPDALRLELRDDVYQALLKGDVRARFTAMHEVGHFFLHPGVPLRRMSGPAHHQHFEDSEWQADCFAAEILMPVHLMRQMGLRTAAAASAAFGVSLRAAIIRIATLKTEGMLRMT